MFLFVFNTAAWKAMISLYYSYLARCHQFMLPGETDFFLLLLAIITFQLYSIDIILLFPSMGNSNELCMYFTLGHLYRLMH